MIVDFKSTPLQTLVFQTMVVQFNFRLDILVNNLSSLVTFGLLFESIRIIFLFITGSSFLNPILA